MDASGPSNLMLMLGGETSDKATLTQPCPKKPSISPVADCLSPPGCHEALLCCAGVEVNRAQYGRDKLLAANVGTHPSSFA